MAAPVVFDEFDASKIVFDTVSKNKRGGKLIKMTYGDNRRLLRIQTPPLFVPFGLSTFSEDGASSSTVLHCSLSERNEHASAFLKTLQSIDDAVFDYCAQNDVECFGKSMSPDRLREDYFKSCVKPGAPKPDGSGSWPPLLKIKVSAFAAPIVFDTERNEVPWGIEDKKYKGHTCMFIIQMMPVWFVNKTFGVSFRLHQMKIVDAPVPTSSYLFKDSHFSNSTKSVEGIAGIKSSEDFDDEYD